MRNVGVILLLMLIATNSSLAYWYTNQQLHNAGIKALRSNNPSLAAQYFSQAAANEHPSSMNNLGYLYLKGNGVSRDYQKARQYFRASADLGDVSAIMNLGFLYANGLGLPRSFRKAEALYQEALDKGHPQAKKALAALDKERTLEEEQFQTLNNLAVEVPVDQENEEEHEVIYQNSGKTEEEQSDRELSGKVDSESINSSSSTSYYEELYRVELEVSSTEPDREETNSFSLEQPGVDTESEVNETLPESGDEVAEDESRGLLFYSLLILLSVYLVACASDRNCFISYLDGLCFFALTLFMVRDLGLFSLHWLILILFSIYFAGRTRTEQISLPRTLQTAFWRVFMTIPALFFAWLLNFFQ